MNDERFESLLADYLAGELSPADEAEFRTELDRDEQRRKLAQSLQAAAAALEADVPDLEQADERSADVLFDRIVLRHLAERQRQPQPMRVARLGTSLLRYAAVIMLAFATGYLVRGWSRTELEGQPSPTPTPPAHTAGAVAPQINDEYIANYARASRTFPQATSFSRALLAVASRGH